MTTFHIRPSRRTALRHVAGVLTTATLTAFGLPTASAAEAGKTIAISFPNSSTIGAVVVSLEQAKRKGKEMGYQVVVDDPGSDLNRQINTLKTWIQAKVPVIVCVVPQPKVFESIAKEARAAGIKWITYGETLTNQDATVGYAQYADGKRLGEYAGEWIEKNFSASAPAKVVVLGYEKGSWGQLRSKGIEDGVRAKTAKYKIVARQDAINPTEGVTVTRALLQATPDINVILGVEDPATEGAYKAWVAAGRNKNDLKGFIGGIDGTAPALTLLKEGNNVYRASMAIPLLAVGDAIVVTADALLKGEKRDGVIVPLELVTSGSPSAQKFLAEQAAK